MNKENQKGELTGHDKDQQDNFINPNTQFISSALSMSWRLAIAILVPVVGGYKLDQHFNTSPLYTIVGFVIAMIATILIIRQVLKEFSVNIQKPGKKS